MIKRLMNSCGIAFSMYSKIPMPQCDWTDDNMKYVMCFFPWIGAVIGALCIGWQQLAIWLGVGDPLRVVVLMLIPFFVTGGIHLDGMLDTADALSSWRPMERRIEILKDSHAGAFAILICVVYFFLLYAVTDMVTVDMLPVYAMLFVVSRSLSGLSVVSFPKMKKEGTGGGLFEKGRDRSDSGDPDLLSGACHRGHVHFESAVRSGSHGRRVFDLRLVLSDGNEKILAGSTAIWQAGF